MATCNQEISGLPVINTCIDNNTYVLITGEPSLKTMNNPNGYGLVKWGVLKGCIGSGIKPIIGVSGRGQAQDPINGTSTYQNNNLAGIGQTNNGEFQFLIDGAVWQNFGINGNQFTFNQLTNTISFPVGFQWYDGSSIFIDLNQ